MDATNWQARAAAVLREPLLHFLLAGALVFAVMAGRDAPDEAVIRIDPAAVATHHRRSTGRDPSASELKALIADQLRTEIYSRDAVALGLDREDDGVKQRLRAKLLAIIAAPAEAQQPSDAQLQALLAADPARYAGPTRYWLEQRFIGDDTAATRAAAPALAAALARGERPALPALPLPDQVSGVAADALAAQFGTPFAAALAGLPDGRWAGPVASGLGLHLVRITRRQAAPPPTLAAVRGQLEADWRRAAVARAVAADWRQRLAAHRVVIAPAP